MSNSLDKEREPGLSAMLETVIIFTDRMEELAGFYQKAFQLGPYQHSPGHMGQQVGPVYLGFDQVQEPAGSERTGATLWFTVDSLHAAFDRLVAMGAKVRYPPTRKPWGAVLASVYDPDGNIIGLSQRQAG
jgi:predicted enzyme related to lactoylglutathione lyase